MNADYEYENLDYMIVISEDAARNPPTKAYCMQYAQSHDADPAKTFIDNESGVGWGKTFDAMDNYASGGLGVPWSALLDGASMEYIMNDYAGEGSMQSNIDALLAN